MGPTRAKPADIRRLRADNPKMRERDLALQNGFSEAEYVAAGCGDNARRIEVRVDELLLGLEAVGEVMALTRNDSAVHEKIGVYDKVVTGKHNAMVLGSEIDLRIFPTVWKHGFAVEKRDGEDVRRSLQFFDGSGEAVHKIHLRPSSNVEVYEALVASLLSADQSDTVAVEERAPEQRAATRAGAEELRTRWEAMTDVHQFFGMLRDLNLTRHDAVRLIGTDYAWPVDRSAVEEMMRRSAESELPIMAFVGSRGCIQIHSGPIYNLKPMGPWLNVMDPTFHLHLRTDHIREVWAVRKPTKDGHVTSVEVYGEDGEMIIQFFGKRQEGVAEREEWRQLAETLPRLDRQTAA